MIDQNIRGGKLLWFSQFIVHHKCFLSNCLLAIGIHYQKQFLPRKFSCEHLFSILTVNSNTLPYYKVYRFSFQYLKYVQYRKFQYLDMMFTRDIYFKNAVGICDCLCKNQPSSH